MKIESTKEYTLTLSEEELRILHALLGATSLESVGKEYNEQTYRMFFQMNEELNDCPLLFEVKMEPA